MNARIAYMIKNPSLDVVTVAVGDNCRIGVTLSQGHLSRDLPRSGYQESPGREDWPVTAGQQRDGHRGVGIPERLAGGGRLEI